MNRLLASLVFSLFATATAGCVADTDDGEEDIDTVEEGLTVASPERALASKLGLKSRFSIGLGNDANGNDPAQAAAFTIGPKVDIHYMYLGGLPGEGGWTDWNSPSGQYLTMQVNAAKAKGVVPMFTLYQAAAWGDGNVGAFNSSDFMTKYWRGVRTMFTLLGAAGVPAIAHIEPDLWGYFQKKGDAPSSVPVKVGSLVSECSDLPSDASGFGKCIIRLGRKLAPKTAIGLSASSFGAYTNGSSDPTRIAKYLDAVSGGQADLIIVETLDRDAGCFEEAEDPNCKRNGSFYWSEADFAAHLAWAKTIRTVGRKPLLWWQMPLGTPSSSPGGSPGRYRDNRVQYLFANTWRFAKAGGIGAVFGKGKANQTTVSTDGGQFKNALTKYLGSGGAGLY